MPVHSLLEFKIFHRSSAKLSEISIGEHGKNKKKYYDIFYYL